MTVTADMPELRYRRIGGGYRREDVEAALEQLLLAVRTVEADLRRLTKQSAELERELRTARSELGVYRANEAHLLSLIERAEGLLAQVELETEASHVEPAGG